MTSEPAYLYRAQVCRVVDGDTVDVEIDLGFDVHFETRVRMFGIDTPEKNSKILLEREKAEAATEFLKSLIDGKEVLLQSFKRDKYGRYLANIYILDLNINQHMITEGHAVPYFGGSK